MSNTTSSLGSTFASIVNNALSAIGNVINAVVQFIAQNADVIGFLVGAGIVITLALGLMGKLPFVGNILGYFGL